MNAIKIFIAIYQGVFSVGINGGLKMLLFIQSGFMFIGINFIISSHSLLSESNIESNLIEGIIFVIISFILITTAIGINYLEFEPSKEVKDLNKEVKK